jgi:hypothetical protein
MWVESDLGAGARFVFTIPTSPHVDGPSMNGSMGNKRIPTAIGERLANAVCVAR